MSAIDLRVRLFVPGVGTKSSGMGDFLRVFNQPLSRLLLPNVLLPGRVARLTARHAHTVCHAATFSSGCAGSAKSATRNDQFVYIRVELTFFACAPIGRSRFLHRTISLPLSYLTYRELEHPGGVTVSDQRNAFKSIASSCLYDDPTKRSTRD